MMLSLLKLAIIWSLLPLKAIVHWVMLKPLQQIALMIMKLKTSNK
nr:MAG TPA: hypothetical protein [Caudoviricetes sp.]